MKIALIRIINQTFRDEDEWVRDHMTDFVEVSQKDYDALREFVHKYNINYKNKDRQYVIVEDETHLLPKTIAEALEFAEKEKQKAIEEEKREKRQEKEKEKLRKQKQAARLKAEIDKLEEYKAKLAKLEKGKN